MRRRDRGHPGAPYAARGRTRRSTAGRGVARHGFTLIEVLVALGIMSGALIGMAAFVGKAQHTVGSNSIASTASDLAAMRIEAVKGSNNYGALEQMAVTETSIIDGPGFTRTTLVTRTNTALGDYKTVTVLVTHPAMTTATRKTIVVGAS